MSQPRNKKIIKVAVGIIGCLLLAVLFFEISGFLFLKIFRLPLEICRPWTIFQYWMSFCQQHGGSKIRAYQSAGRIG
ncbi:MAG: hypothetical protein KH225_07080 [Proteobacteria bacterium]|nr:hypothetical protein [Pseudomonadota bacterium]